MLYGEWEELIGYFKKTKLPLLGNGPASIIGWGGETYNPWDHLHPPPMGSGYFQDEGSE